MSALHPPGRAALLGMALMAVVPAFAAGKAEAPFPIAPASLPAAPHPAVSLGPGSYLIDFENLAEGATVNDQYAAWGVSFIANAYATAGSPNDGWADNTDMTVVSSTGGNVANLGGPSLVSGNILRAYYTGWVFENGDPSFAMVFDKPISAISIDFASIGPSAGITGIDIYRPDGTYVTTVLAAGAGQQTVSYTGTDIGYVGVRPGDYDDWVAVDNISFTVAAAVPEPETYGLLALGLGVLSIAARRRRR